jgi:hypothetical protein
MHMPVLNNLSKQGVRVNVSTIFDWQSNFNRPTVMSSMNKVLARACIKILA